MTRFNASPLAALSDALTLFVMAGLTVASAAAMAAHVDAAQPVLLPPVVVTAQSTRATEAVRLPTVVVTAKRSTQLT